MPGGNHSWKANRRSDLNQASLVQQCRDLGLQHPSEASTESSPSRYRASPPNLRAFAAEGTLTDSTPSSPHRKEQAAARSLILPRTCCYRHSALEPYLSPSSGQDNLSSEVLDLSQPLLLLSLLRSSRFQAKTPTSAY